jgi:hypothetical protein
VLPTGLYVQNINAWGVSSAVADFQKPDRYGCQFIWPGCGYEAS